MAKRKQMITVPIRIDGDVLELVRELSRMSGRSVEDVVPVLLALGTLKHIAELKHIADRNR
jgi:hypothetical protein